MLNRVFLGISHVGITDQEVEFSHLQTVLSLSKRQIKISKYVTSWRHTINLTYRYILATNNKSRRNIFLSFAYSLITMILVWCKSTMKRCCIVIVLNFEVYYQFVLKSNYRMCNFYLRKARCLKFNGGCAASVTTCQFC